MGLFNSMINNYFSHKEEAILAYGIDRAARARAALRARPAAKTFRKTRIDSVSMLMALRCWQ